MKSGPLIRSFLLLGCALATGIIAHSPARADIVINEFLSCNIDGLEDLDGDTPDWLELHNTGADAVDLFQWGLSDDPDAPFRWTFPSRSIEPGARLLVFASGKDLHGSELHTDFKIGAGETLTLTTDQTVILDSVEAPLLPPDVSYGRLPGGGDWRCFTTPTPGEANDTPAFLGVCPRPHISAPSGICSASFQTEIGDTTGQLELVTWTEAGWDPTAADTPAGAPLTIDGTTILRARGFRTGWIPSPIATRTYLFDESPNLPILSLVTDPDNLWHVDTGIYVLGDDYQPGSPNYGANFWEDWEKPAHLEFFDVDRDEGFALDLGIKIHGGWTRCFPQKSLRCMVRGGYGTRSIEYPLFPGHDVTEFETLILRNSGNDWSKTHFRDALMQEIACVTGIDHQAYRPAVMFLNGEYWGIHNIRERIDDHYIAAHHGVDEDEMDIIKCHTGVMAGTCDHYQAMMAFVEANDLSLPANFEYVRALMDTDNFTAYQIAEIYFCNTDWPGNNIQCWRPRTPDGLWRWQFYDLDFGLGGFGNHYHNTLSFALEDDGPSWPNPPHSTLLFRRLMANDTFRIDFVNRYCDLLNTIFQPASIDPIAALFEQRIAGEIDRHLARWEQDPAIWNTELVDMHLYIDSRLPYARSHLRSQFGYPGQYTLTLSVAPAGGGSISLTTVEVEDEWSGVYLRGNPVRLTAVPRPGYVFAGWSDPELPDSNIVWIDSEMTTRHVAAEFVPESAGALAIVINEINYNSATDFNPGDWVELHNRGEATVDVSGWIFRDGDDGHSFVLPQDTRIAAGGHLVLCSSITLFETVFPEVENAIGDLGFGFSGGGEALRLFDASDLLLDAVEYDDDAPWPTEPDGDGPTLELRHPALDNALPEFWSASDPTAPHGTPGARNSVYTPTAAAETIPAALRLAAPWPNPFNPATRIAFGIPADGDVRLDVFDANGRRVATLIDDRLAAGEHAARWRADGLPSGLYFARLSHGGAAVSRKMLLLK